MKVGEEYINSMSINQYYFNKVIKIVEIDEYGQEITYKYLFNGRVFKKLKNEFNKKFKRKTRYKKVSRL